MSQVILLLTCIFANLKNSTFVDVKDEDKLIRNMIEFMIVKFDKY